MKQIVHNKFYHEENYYPEYSLDTLQDSSEIYISQVGHFQGSGAFNMNYITNRFFCYIILAGKTRLKLDGNEYVLKKGDFCFFFPDQHKILEEAPEANLENIYINLNGSKVETIFNNIGFTRQNQIFPGIFDIELATLYQQIHESYNSDHSIVYQPVIAAWKLIEILSKRIKPARSRRNSNIAEATNLILRQEFTSTITIEEIARRLDTSRVTLFRKFKERYLISPKKFLDNLRMNQACLMLRRTDTPISEVAKNCGFESVQHFNRMFKRRYEVAPTTFRNQKT